MSLAPPPAAPSNRDLRDAQLAHVLAQGYRDGLLVAADALRVLRHEMRRRNTNRKLSITTRSVAAQAVIDRHALAGSRIPQNASDDALHADHVHALTELDLTRRVGVEQWLAALGELREVVCVTAAENYRLEKIEKQGATGWEKYALAGVALAPPVPRD